MTETEVSVNVGDSSGWADSMPLLILAICLLIAAIAFLYGLRRLQRRRHAHRDDHLAVDMAEPESLSELPPDERP
jgi:hypothetical protein